MSGITGIVLVLATICTPTALAGSAPAEPRQEQTVTNGASLSVSPAFSWDTLPVAWHSSNTSGVWTDMQTHILAKYAMVTLEKMQGLNYVVPANTLHSRCPRDPWCLYSCQNVTDLSRCMITATGPGPVVGVEEQMIAAGKAIKLINPKVVRITGWSLVFIWHVRVTCFHLACPCDSFSFVSCPFHQVVAAYLNSVISHPWYTGAAALAKHPDYWLRDANGTLMHNLANPPPDNETWLTFDHTNAQAAALWASTCEQMVSSKYIDSCFVDGCTKTPSGLEKGKQAAYGPAKMKMLVNLQKVVPGPLICGSNGAVYPGIAATQIQNWGKHGDYATREIPMMQKATKVGAIFQAHGAQVCKNKGDPQHPDVQTELAAFLVVAQKGCYYMCSGWSGTVPTWYKVYDMPLGAPLANGTLGADGIWRRSFASGTNVTFDTHSNKGSITWARSPGQIASHTG
jgi:hypothetical protein